MGAENMLNLPAELNPNYSNIINRFISLGGFYSCTSNNIEFAFYLPGKTNSNNIYLTRITLKNEKLHYNCFYVNKTILFNDKKYNVKLPINCVIPEQINYIVYKGKNLNKLNNKWKIL